MVGQEAARAVIAVDRFSHFVAIDWSGAKEERQNGIAVAICQTGTAAPLLVRPSHKWSRAEVLEWLLCDLPDDALVGLDLSPAFPFLDAAAYFPDWPESPPDAHGLWALVEKITDTDPHLGASSFIAHPEARRHFRQTGHVGDKHPPGRGRLRLCELGQKAMGLAPYSCFNLVGAAQVGKSSLTGMRVLNRLAGKIAIWPFDPMPPRGAVIVEIYTALAARAAGIRAGKSKMRDAASLDAALEALGSEPHSALARYDDHATDAILSAAWLRNAAHRSELWQPCGMTDEIARTEGWTFGVPAI